MIEDKAAKIKLLILDVDGVLTNGQILINALGEEIKNFNTKDGQGLKLLIEAGIDVVIITGRASKALEFRAKDLGIREVYQGIENKGSFCIELIERKGLIREQVCCVGDDLPDIPVFDQAGLSITVADAVKEVRDLADFITKNRGGMGAVREVCEFILKAKGLWPQIVSVFQGGRD